VDGPDERSGDQVQTYQIGRHRVAITCRGGVLPPTPYSLFLAEHIPERPGCTVVDVGTGSGILGIVARLQGAVCVYVLDINPEAVAVAMENAARNAVQEGFVPLPTGRTMLPLPAGASIDVVLCNPAQLPLPQSAKADDPFYAGEDGRQMIEGGHTRDAAMAVANRWAADDPQLVDRLPREHAAHGVARARAARAG
jgi:methylase of polypeptide subunit release factors